MIFGRKKAKSAGTLSDGSSDTWLFVGLGNPGAEHAHNRHNIGFMAIDRISEWYNFPSYRTKFQGLFCEKNIENQKLVLLKPTTYMNESGRAVQEIARFYKIKPDRIVTFYDELDIAPGKLRAKFGGGAAGHNGIRSMQKHLGTPDFWRVRLGIGHPGDKSRVSGYVLHDFSKSEGVWLEPLLDACARHMTLLFEGEAEHFMTKVAMDAPPLKAKKEINKPNQTETK